MWLAWCKRELLLSDGLDILRGSTNRENGWEVEEDNWYFSSDGSFSFIFNSPSILNWLFFYGIQQMCLYLFPYSYKCFWLLKYSTKTHRNRLRNLITNQIKIFSLFLSWKKERFFVCWSFLHPLKKASSFSIFIILDIDE